MNRNISTILLVLGCVMFVLSQSDGQPSGATSDPVTIFSVQTAIDATSSTLEGSQQGGTSLYISGMGFDPSSSNDQVFVGTYPCIISLKGATQDKITCDTTPPTGTALSNLPISVIVAGKTPFTSSTYKFSFTSGSTPILAAVYPRSAGGHDQIKFYGIHRITNLGDSANGLDMGDVRGLSIGSQLCNRFDIIEAAINANDWQFITCSVSPDQQGGYYNVTEWVTPGYAKPIARTLYGSIALNRTYQFIVQPEIATVSSHTGGTAGQTLTIGGTGFSIDSTKVQVRVAGMPCTVQSSTESKVVCELGASPSGNTFGALPTTTTNTQLKGFISGSGLNYARYDITNLVTKTTAGLRAAIAGNSATITLQEQGIKGDLQTPNIYSGVYGQVFTGYFVAPTAGNYIFRGLADDLLSVYMSNVSGSAEVSYTTPLIEATSYSQSSSSDNYYYIGYSGLTSAPVALAAGQSRYIEVYHLNNAGPGNMLVSVEVPNTLPLPNKVYSVQKIAIVPTVVQEIITWTQTGATSGSTTFQLIRKKGVTVIYNVTRVLNWNASASDFQTMLVSFDLFKDYSPSVTLEKYDAADNLITTGTPFKSVWTATVNMYRDPTITSQSITLVNNLVSSNPSVTPTISEAKIQSHSAPVSGSFGLVLGNQALAYFDSAGAIQTNIPYNTSASTLKGWMAAAWGCPDIEVINGQGSTNPDGNIYIVSFVGCNGPLAVITSSNTFLQGGSSGTVPAVTVTQLQAGSNNLLVEPVTVEYLQTAAPLPQVLVTVAGSLSKCVGDCSYQVLPTATPILNSATLNPMNSQITLNVSDPSNIGFQLVDINVTLDGVRCRVNTGFSIDNFNCTLDKNPDNSPLARAGSYMPQVEIKNVGFAVRGASFVNINVSLAANSLTVTTSGLSGGNPIGIIGHGFPFSLSETPFTVTMCGTLAVIKSVTNTQIGIVSPPCTAANAATSIIVAFKGQTATLNFNYDPSIISPNVTSITPSSASPVLKGNMTITGSGFGTNINSLSVYLVNSLGIRTYQMNVLSASDTQLLVKIPGGESGVFTVTVHRAGFGNSQETTTGAAQFKYEIVITSISPTTGSGNGGTILTINGRNFCPLVINNQAYIGDAINWNCNILTATTTQITCITPPMNSAYTTAAQNVVVVGRAMIDSTCEGSCTFTYNNDTPPTVQTPNSLNFVGGSSYVLSGTQFTRNGVAPKVKVGDVYATVVSSTATSVTFIYPSLVAGTYPLNVYVDGVGYASPTINSTTNLNVTGLSNATGSLIGNIIYINGNGLIPSTNSGFNLTITRSSIKYPYTIVSDTPSQLGVKFMGGVNSYVFTFNYAYNGAVFSFNYTTLNTSTPKINLVGSASIVYTSNLVINLTRTTFITTVPTTVTAIPITTTGAQFAPEIPLSITTINSFSGAFEVDGSSLGAGKYNFTVYMPAYGYATVNSSLEIQASPYTVNSVVSAYQGGKLFTVIGNGLSAASRLEIGGLKAALVSSSPTSLVYTVPPYVTKQSQDEYKLVSSAVLKGTPFADTAANAALSFDGLFGTTYTSSAATCFVGVDFGSILRADIKRIRYYPNPTWKSAAQYILGASIKASNNNSTWDTLATIDSTVHTGWNIWRPDVSAPLTQHYRYVRFEHNSTSKCNLAEFEVEGIFYSGVTTSLDSNLVDASFSDGFHSVSWSGKVEYRADATSVVNQISPTTASPVGGVNVTLTGTNFGTDVNVVSVVVDGVACAVQTVTSTSIVCTVGARPNLPSAFTFDVRINGNYASLNCSNFTYAFRWSDPATWGGDIPPIDGDTVYVPKGMVLLVDQSTPNLKTIIVEGSIVFADEQEMVIETGSIIVNFGTFTAGTEKKPYTNLLTFVLHGGYYEKQLPGFGNKAIGCHCCKFDMYGTPRTLTWTELAATAMPGNTSIQLLNPADWRSGEQIVIASTSTDHYESERRTISSYDNTTGILTFDEPLLYKHLGVVETFGSGSDSIPMRAEVGLLTRNIVVTGDSDSVPNKYGAHIMMHGSADQGLVGHIAYTEVTQCGQPAIVGRYCMHFHMNGDVSDSYVIGNSVHDSFARILTLHGVHYLRVEWNVGHMVKGHNFFLEDGIETYNVIQNNLAVSTIQVWNMLQTDTSCASFWITNPLNIVRNNRAAGSDFYGFWYEVKQHPDGVSATSDICPQGLPIGESHDNIAHSNLRFGLRVFVLHSSTYPCKPYRDDSQIDPWAGNPSEQNIFYNYVLYRNGAAGLLSEEVGNTIYRNFTIADSGQAGMQFHKTNFSKELVVAQDNIIIGQSVNNGLPDANLTNTYAIITPRTDGFKVSGLKLYNFPPQTTAFQSCSVCDQMTLVVTTGKCAFFERISYNNVTSKFVFWNGIRRNIFYDIDGSLSSTLFNGAVVRPNSTILPYFPHNDISGKCFNNTNNTLWDTSLICDNTTVVRTVMFTNALPSSFFQNQIIKFYRLQTADQNISALTTGHTTQFFVKGMKDKKNSWAAPFVLNQFYDVWWNQGIDWTSVAVVPSQYFTDQDIGMVVRFNYTETRELFEITKRVSGRLQLPYISQQAAQLNTSTCGAGDYYHDSSNRYLYVCVSGKQKPIFTYIDLNGIKCRYLCPQPTGEFTKEPFLRLWSNATQWPGGVMPNANDNITINGNWTIIMDVDPAPISYLTINGDVLVGDRNTAITAKGIWIRAGSLNAGNASSPFNNTLTITLNGNKDDRTFVVDPSLAPNKYMVVTGTLNLYGPAPSTVWTRLTAKAAAGATTISVASTSGWAIGDEIVIGPTFNTPNQTERVTITALTSTSVTFTPALNWTHYGDASALTNDFGTLDMRAAVGHITRNIKIVAGADAGYGFRVVSYGMMDENITRLGAVSLRGVQFIGGGQKDTDYAALHFLGNPSQTVSTVESCSFVESNAYSLNLDSSANVTVTNNVFFKARKYIVAAISMLDYKFTNNLMIGAQSRPNMAGAKDNIACYFQWKGIDFNSDNNLVTENVCQGSELNGFVLPFTPCEFLDQSAVGFFDNTAGTCIIGTTFNVVPGACIGGKGVKGYANSIGYLASPPGPMTLDYRNFMLADNGRAMGLRHGHGGFNGDNNTAFWRDSWVSAASRPKCNYCYGAGATDCQNNLALRMMVTTINGETMPDKFGTGFDTICRQEAFDSKAFLINVTFDNYRVTYTGNLTSCANNLVFMPHPLAHDLTGSHYLTQTYCTNCEQNAWAYFSPPDPGQLGWFGGCGLLLCTGFNNYIIQDHDGSFMGSPGTIVANNSWIGDNEPGCTFNSAINGYVCARDDLAVLEYESIAPDFNTRIMWPVSLSYWGGNWTSITNGYREWDWNGREPNNKRLGRFVSTIRLGQVYNMSFQAQPPSDIRFQIQRRTITGNNSDWIAIRIYYPVANAISVLVNNVASNNSILATSSEDVTDRYNVCGANKYFYKNGTIAFIVTGDMKCQVRVTLTSNVQITSRLMVTMDSFFSNGGVATFIDKMCAFLNITTDRMKVVGVTSGSTIVDYNLINSITTTPENSTTTTVSPGEQAAGLQALLDKIQGASTNSIDLGPLGPVTSSTGKLNIVNTDGSLYQEPNDNTNAPDNSALKTTIIVAVVVSVLSASLVGVTTYLVIKKLRTRERIEPEESEQRANDIDIEVYKEKDVRGTDMELHERELAENRSGLGMIN